MHRMPCMINKSAATLTCAFLSVLIFLSGCMQSSPTSTLPLSLDPAPADPDALFADFERLLQRYVSDRGIVAAERLAKDTQATSVLAAVVCRPLAQPDRADTADWLNAHNAAALVVLAHAGAATRLSELTDDPLARISFACTDHEISLADLARNARPNDDWRRPFALAMPTLAGPPIAREPYRSDRLDAQLNLAVQRYLASCAGLRLDFANHRILLGPLLWDRRDFFLDDYQRRTGRRPATLATALILWADPVTQRRLADTVGFSAAPLPPSDLLALPAWRDVKSLSPSEEMTCPNP